MYLLPWERHWVFCGAQPLKRKRENPGILAGIILAIGRIIGETAALLYTSGTVAQVPNLMGSGRTLALHMYVLSSEGLHMNQASATAVVILLFVLIINGLSGMVAKRIAKG